MSPANPLKHTRTVHPDGKCLRRRVNDHVRLHTIGAAESLDAALTLAKTWPFLEVGGALEVSELAARPMSK